MHLDSANFFQCPSIIIKKKWKSTLKQNKKKLPFLPVDLLKPNTFSDYCEHVIQK